jgi:hypothetical protein
VRCTLTVTRVKLQQSLYSSWLLVHIRAQTVNSRDLTSKVMDCFKLRQLTLRLERSGVSMCIAQIFYPSSWILGCYGLNRGLFKRLTQIVFENNKKVKIKAVPLPPCRRKEGEQYSSYSFLTSTLDGGEWLASRPGRALPRRKDLCYHWIGGWGASELVWTQRLKILCRGSTPGRPVCSQTLYWLSYPRRLPSSTT